MLLLALAVFGIYWSDHLRREGYDWGEVGATLLLHVAVVWLLALLFPEWVWKTALLAYLSFPWWLSPVIVWRTFRADPFPAEAVLEVYDPARHTWPSDVAERVERAAAALERAGLTRLGTWQLLMMKNRSLTVVLESADGRERAVVFGSTVAVPSARRETTYSTALHALVRAVFADGRRLEVSDALPSGQVSAPNATVFHLPGFQGDPAGLLAAFRALRARRFADATPVRADRGMTVPESFADETPRFWARNVAAGLYRRTGDGGYALTLRGALVNAWGVLFPFREIAAWWTARAERRLRAELGLGEPPTRTGPWSWSARNGVAVAALAAVLLLPLLPFVPSSLAAGESRPARPYRLPEGFAVPADFAGAVRALETLAGGRAVPLELEDPFTLETRRTEGFEVAFPADRADSLLAAAAPLFRARGFLLFRDDQSFGIGGEPERVALYPRDAPYEVMALAGTNGANYGLETEDVVAWLRALERRHPFVVTGIGTDHVQGRFVRPLDRGEARKLARQFYDFCPDIVTQGVGSVGALEDELRANGILYCWWD